MTMYLMQVLFFYGRGRYILDIVDTTDLVQDNVCLITQTFVIADIDECSNASHKCHPNANCTNTVGSHSCSCKEGFSGNGRSCSGRTVNKLVSLQGTDGEEPMRVFEN